MKTRQPPPTELQIAAAQRAAKRITPLIAKLSPTRLESLVEVMSALIVATEKEADALEKLIVNGKPDYKHVSAVARGIVAKHKGKP